MVNWDLWEKVRIRPLRERREIDLSLPKAPVPGDELRSIPGVKPKVGKKGRRRVVKFDLGEDLPNSLPIPKASNGKKGCCGSLYSVMKESPVCFFFVGFLFGVVVAFVLQCVFLSVFKDSYCRQCVEYEDKLCYLCNVIPELEAWVFPEARPTRVLGSDTKAVELAIRTLEKRLAAQDTEIRNLQKENDWRKTNQLSSHHQSEKLRHEGLWYKLEMQRLQEDLKQLGQLTPSENASVKLFAQWIREEVPKQDLCHEFNSGNAYQNLAKYHNFVVRKYERERNDRSEHLRKLLSRVGRKGDQEYGYPENQNA